MKEEHLKVLAELILLSDRSDKVVQACTIYLECGLREHAIRLLATNADDSDLHYSLFYCIVTSLVKDSAIGQHSDILCHYIPSNFLLPDFCHVIRGFEDQSQTCDVFGNREVSLADMEPLLRELMTIRIEN